MNKNKFFTHKFLPLLSVFLFTIFVFFTNVKATSETKTVTIDNITYTLPSDCTDNFIIAEVNDYYVLYFADDPFWGVTISNNDVVLYSYSDEKNFGNSSYRDSFYQRWIKKGCYDFSDTSNYTSSNYGTWAVFSAKYVGYDGVICLYNSNDIKFLDGTIFFQKTPVPVLVGIMKQEQTEKKTVQEILGVLPLILVVVVSFLGLRKALSWLSTLLIRS